VSEYANAVYNAPQEGFLAMGLETGMPAPDVVTLGASPSLFLVGYADVPGMDAPEGTAPIAPTGTYKPVAFLPGRREPIVNGSIVLGAGAGPEKLIQAAMRELSSWTGGRHLCQPVVAFAGGAVGACDATRSSMWLARCCLIDTLSLNMQFGQPATIQFSAPALALQRNVTPLTSSVVNHNALAAAGGEPFGWQHVTLLIGGIDYTPLLASLQLQISNGVTRKLMRKLLAGGNSNALTRAARDLQPGVQNVNFGLGLAGKLPATLTDNGGSTLNLGQIDVILSDGTASHTFSVAQGALQTYGQSPVSTGGEWGFNANVLSGGMSYTYDNGA
jgi:hypothetical protein